MKRETGSARTDEIPLPRSSRAWQQFWPAIANISISISICRKLKFPGKTRPLQVAQFRGSDSLFAPHFTGFWFFFFFILSEFEFRNATSAETQPASQPVPYGCPPTTPSPDPEGSTYRICIIIDTYEYLCPISDAPVTVPNYIGFPLRPDGALKFLNVRI